MVIPEDPTHNGYILQPLTEALMAAAGKPNARVTVLNDPHIRGVDKAILEAPLLARDHPMYDLFLLYVDRDGRIGDGENRLQRLRDAERRAKEHGRLLLGCAAVEEIEVWLLAGHPARLTQLGFNWQDVRQHDHPKEQFFDWFLAVYGDRGAGQGRKRLMCEGLADWPALLHRCPELADLLRRIQDALQTSKGQQ